ncbi:hypothetical protein EPUS_00530 [Endocarpon pusillum Z07020]|uniref:Uncharacterized protein n=1 Tax=Endocarpon pusillum (strain Z07020 / HMAS-L-300199) TaxID=1263415 RepID=U1GIA7_ENDPU|nr:uncharacterized protein EPUS_00530 [Endocarpon pusillum Z07020]ERF71541.1 hypothetical protein EPUS_00530 [Endocarpon pusillum Z07020]
MKPFQTLASTPTLAIVSSSTPPTSPTTPPTSHPISHSLPPPTPTTTSSKPSKPGAQIPTRAGFGTSGITTTVLARALRFKVPVLAFSSSSRLEEDDINRAADSHYWDADAQSTLVNLAYSLIRRAAAAHATFIPEEAVTSRVPRAGRLARVVGLGA